MEDRISPEFSLKWTNVGTMQSGRFLTPKTTESLRTVNAVSLSDILEEEPDKKYFLSKEQMEKMVFK